MWRCLYIICKCQSVSKRALFACHFDYVHWEINLDTTFTIDLVSMCACVCVCVCVGKRERERGRSRSSDGGAIRYRRDFWVSKLRALTQLTTAGVSVWERVYASVRCPRMCAQPECCGVEKVTCTYLLWKRAKFDVDECGVWVNILQICQNFPVFLCQHTICFKS